MTTNKSGAGIVPQCVHEGVRVRQRVVQTSRRSARHANAKRHAHQRAAAVGVHSLPANKITMTNDKMIDASIAPALGGRPGALSVPERSATRRRPPPSAPAICVGAFHAVVPPEPLLPAISAHIPNPTMQ